MNPASISKSSVRGVESSINRPMYSAIHLSIINYMYSSYFCAGFCNFLEIVNLYCNNNYWLPGIDNTCYYYILVLPFDTLENIFSSKVIHKWLTYYCKHLIPNSKLEKILTLEHCVCATIIVPLTVKTSTLWFLIKQVNLYLSLNSTSTLIGYNYI